MRGPAIFLAQFMGSDAPFDSFASLCRWAGALGYRGVQVPTWDARIFDLQRAAESRDYCDELRGIAAAEGIAITELSTHLQGQLIAVSPAQDLLFDAFAPKALRGDIGARTQWARQQLLWAAQASAHLRLTTHVTFSGALLWHTVYPWPQRPAGLVAEAFDELARRWQPLLDAFDAVGVDVCFEIHPGEDLHDGVTFERFLDRVQQHPRANILFDPSHLLLQHIDYLQFIDIYHERIKAFHVKDAEFVRNGRSGVYGGYQDWLERAGRFRSLGDGQIDFRGVFSRLTQYRYTGWAVMEWECCLKHPAQGAAEGAAFIAAHMIRPVERSFDDFAGGARDADFNRRILGL